MTELEYEEAVVELVAYIVDKFGKEFVVALYERELSEVLDSAADDAGIIGYD